MGEDERIEDVASLIVEEALADIVLVKKNEMLEWQRQQEQLQYELKVTQKKVKAKMAETKSKYDRELKNEEQSKDLEIRDLEQRYDDRKTQKVIADKQNYEAMQKMESNHLHEVEDIQGSYEKKLYIESSNYLKLEQEKLEMKNYYEKKIEDLRKQN